MVTICTSCFDSQPLCILYVWGLDDSHCKQRLLLGRIRYSVLGPPGFELETSHQEPIKPLLDLIRKAGIFDGI
jgi:hypothetical protein